MADVHQFPSQTAESWLADIDELVRASKVLEKALLLSEIQGWQIDWMATSMTDFRKAVKRMEHYK